MIARKYLRQQQVTATNQYQLIITLTGISQYSKKRMATDFRIMLTFIGLKNFNESQRDCCVDGF